MLLGLEPVENVALFTTLGAILVAVLGTTIPAVLANRKAKETSEAVGTPNGKGNVVEMLGRLLDRQARGDVRTARIEETINHHTEALGRMEGHQARLEARLGALERDVPVHPSERPDGTHTDPEDGMGGA